MRTSRPSSAPQRPESLTNSVPSGAKAGQFGKPRSGRDAHDRLAVVRAQRAVAGGAHGEPPGPVDGQPEHEPRRPRDLLDRAAGNPVELSGLAAGPDHAGVRVVGDPLGMVEPVDQHARAAGGGEVG